MIQPCGDGQQSRRSGTQVDVSQSNLSPTFSLNLLRCIRTGD